MSSANLTEVTNYLLLATPKFWPLSHDWLLLSHPLTPPSVLLSPCCLFLDLCAVHPPWEYWPLWITCTFSKILKTLDHKDLPNG